MRSPKLNMLLSDGCSSRPATALADADQQTAHQRAGHAAEPAHDHDHEGEQGIFAGQEGASPE